MRLAAEEEGNIELTRCRWENGRLEALDAWNQLLHGGEDVGKWTVGEGVMDPREIRLISGSSPLTRLLKTPV